MTISGRILVVEDDIDIAELLRIYFTGQGFLVETVARGDAALAACRANLPDLVILDILLPDMDGYAVCRELRTNIRTGNDFSGLCSAKLRTGRFTIEPAGVKSCLIRPLPDNRRSGGLQQRQAFLIALIIARKPPVIFSADMTGPVSLKKTLPSGASTTMPTIR